jgi:hypothetical protein
MSTYAYFLRMNIIIFYNRILLSHDLYYVYYVGTSCALFEISVGTRRSNDAPCTNSQTEYAFLCDVKKTKFTTRHYNIIMYIMLILPVYIFFFIRPHGHTRRFCRLILLCVTTPRKLFFTIIRNNIIGSTRSSRRRNTQILVYNNTRIRNEDEQKN